MPRWVVTALLLGAASFGAHAHDDELPKWTIQASISGKGLLGQFERSHLSGAPTADQAPSMAEAVVAVVQRGSSFQIKIKLVDPTGVMSDVTASSKLRYSSHGCLIVAADGVATVQAAPNTPATCKAGEPMLLTVIYIDKPAGIAAMNMYTMQID